MINYFPCNKAFLCTYRLISEIYSRLGRGKEIERVLQGGTETENTTHGWYSTAFWNVVRETLFDPNSPKNNYKMFLLYT